VVPEYAWQRVRDNSKRWRKARGGGMVTFGAALLRLRADGRVYGSFNAAVGQVASSTEGFWDSCMEAARGEGWGIASDSSLSNLLRPVYPAWAGLFLPHLCRFIEHPEAALLVQTFVVDALRRGKRAEAVGSGLQRAWHLSLWSRCKTGDLWRKDSMGLQSGFRWRGPGKCRWVNGIVLGALW